MRPITVVEGEVFSQPNGEFCHVAVALEVHVLILHVAPETFHEYVVQGSTSSVHTDFDFFTLQNFCECRTRELRALVTVKDLWLAVSAQRVFQAVNAERGVHAVAYGPSQKSRQIQSLKYAFTLGNENDKSYQSPEEEGMH